MTITMGKKKKLRSNKNTVRNSKFEDLLVLVKTLRRKCPWDRIQTLKSFKNNIIEEAYECVEAIEDNNAEKLTEEIGDILFVAVFVALLYEQERGMSISSTIIRTINKYRKKHPHVFKNKDLKNADAVFEFWQRSKKDIFRGIPRSMPAMHAARLVQERAAKLGFDWPECDGPLGKIGEELQELKATRSPKKRFEEFGDLIFACVNYARHMKVDPERALHEANRKFINRFRKVIRELKKQGKEPHKVSLEEMDRIWDEIKRPVRPQRKKIQRTR